MTFLPEHQAHEYALKTSCGMKCLENAGVNQRQFFLQSSATTVQECLSSQTNGNKSNV